MPNSMSDMRGMISAMDNPDVQFHVIAPDSEVLGSYDSMREAEKAAHIAVDDYYDAGYHKPDPSYPNYIRIVAAPEPDEDGEPYDGPVVKKVPIGNEPPHPEWERRYGSRQ